MEVWMLKNYKVYDITYVADVNQYDKYLNTVEEMIESLQIETKK